MTTELPDWFKANGRFFTMTDDEPCCESGHEWLCDSFGCVERQRADIA